MKRIANFKIDDKIANLESFVNYNASITGDLVGNQYLVFHWGTLILTYNTETQSIEYLRADYISQTTSTLVGRILRSLPRSAVIAQIADTADKRTQRRLSSMARI